MARHGYIEDFYKMVESLKKSGVSFRIEMSGMTRIIYFTDAHGKTTNKNVYFGHKGIARMEGLELVTGIRRELKKRIEAGEKPPKFKKNTKVVLFHVPNIQSVVKEQESVAEIDLNACYWTTAHKLGFISDELFKKGWKKRRTAKIGLLTAIGSLNKQTYTEEYDWGKSQGVERSNKDDMFRPYYWAVINEVNRLMHESIKKIPEPHFIMWLTDCIYLKKDSKEIMKNFFAEQGYEFKEETSTITKVDRNRVFWVNHKTGEEKYVFFSKSVRIK